MKNEHHLIARLAADRRGVSAIVVGLSMTGILGFAGLAVDVGLWYGDKRLCQTAADAAAFTADNTLSDDTAAGESSTTAFANAKAAAIAVAANYGLTSGTGGVTVTVNNPPSSGTHTSNSQAVEVIINKPESLFFSSLFTSSVTVGSRAVSAPVTTTTGSGAAGCILQLGQGAISLSNGVQVTANNCGVAGDATGSAALSVIGGASLTVASINLVGGITQNNGGVITDSGVKNTGGSATADPYASYSVSSAEATAGSQYSSGGWSGASSSCTGTLPTSPSSKNSLSAYSATPYQLTPGYYCGGISVSNGNSINFAPGVYIIDGGTLSLGSGKNTATAGVTFVLTGSGSNYAVLNIGNGGTLNVNAPATGSTAGIAFFGDPNNPNTVTLEEGASVVANGAYYFPGSTVNYTDGSSNTSSCTQLVAKSISFAGGATFSLNCSGYGTQQIGGSTTTTTISIVE